MYKIPVFLCVLLLTARANSQQLKLSANVMGRGWIEFANGYKKTADLDRSFFVEYEQNIKKSSLTFNASIGYSRLAYNQRIDSLSTDTYNKADVVHFRPVGLKMYFPAGRRSKSYVEVMAGVDYLANHFRKYERANILETDLKNLGFSVGASGKAGFRIEFNGGRNAFDLGVNSTTDLYSRMYTDDTKTSKLKIERTSLFFTFYKSLKNEK